MAELRPGLFAELFAAIGAAGEAKAREALLRLGDAAERQAKVNASSGSHAWGTPTPARPGSGPAIISGTLRRSITRTEPVRVMSGWELKVGTMPGQVPPYGRTPSSRYGLYLETGLRNGATYPFLGPAVRFVRTTVLPQVFQAVFRPGWPRL
ncbi:hypothetical protein [Kitasatospora cathayae]|uniref:HK97 gp10 family phage protein n=1 Tax=Kitasatospora cathayae TaxID=3004092 RepID=A0ABY7QBQ2_9ACTN|nr:hypothetical protein [Kitasatospora sp. HUAS 3-15]WBP89541.1 hypothetical protein O1G21_29330 [Kitasatospora sp. HUAS 3-15]